MSMYTHLLKEECNKKCACVLLLPKKTFGRFNTKWQVSNYGPKTG